VSSTAAAIVGAFDGLLVAVLVALAVTLVRLRERVVRLEEHAWSARFDDEGRRR
jgi:hypothetical protein